MEELLDNGVEKTPTAWVLRYEIDKNKTAFDNEFQFDEHVGNAIKRNFIVGGSQMCEVIRSEEIMDDYVIRIRPYDVNDDEDSTVSMFLRELNNIVLNDIVLRGFPEITKVSYTQSADDCKQKIFDPDTGAYIKDEGNWLLETDGVALARVLGVPGIDATRTTTNSIYEVL